MEKSLSTIEISTEMVKNKLLNFNDNKPPGPDEIHPITITIIISKSLNSGTNPFQWQEALITAIFNKDKRNNPVNYRPISFNQCQLTLV